MKDFIDKTSEKSGTPITKLFDYYLSGIKDPRTQAKTYHGALDKGWITEPGLEKEVFTLKVSGESMINAGIYDGDIVIVERCNTARNGEIVVAMTDENEVTLKTFYKEDGYFRLQPENDTMKPFIFKNITILGKAIGLYRKL